MFGFHNRKDEGYLGNLRDRGHDLFYHYDATGNVTDLTDHLGSEVLPYRYDAFGGVFTQLWTPYNQQDLTGKTYDSKASLMDYSARWYSPSAGRFTTQDTWPGLPQAPLTENRYKCALNNRINITDPSGHAPCYEGDDGSLHCGYNADPDKWPVVDHGNGGGGGDTGGDTGGGTSGGGDSGGDTGGGVITPPWWMDLNTRITQLQAAAGVPPTEHERMLDQYMFLIGDYNDNLSYAENRQILQQDLQVYGPTNDAELRLAVTNLQQSQGCLSMAQSGQNVLSNSVCRGVISSQGFGELPNSVGGISATVPHVVAGVHAIFGKGGNEENLKEEQYYGVTEASGEETNIAVDSGNGYKYWNKTEEFQDVKGYQRDDIIDPN